MPKSVTTPCLDGRRILITGAARGLGAEFAEAIGRAGASIALADVLHERGEAKAAALREQHINAHFVPLDLAEPSSINACVDRAVYLLGGLDGLVNNGAITNSGGKSLEELEIDVWDRVMQVNVRGSWLMTRAVLPELRQAGGGNIINIASDTALWGAPKLLAYVASKGAVISMTRSLARELGPDHIVVNAIAPGLTDVEATAYVPIERQQFYLQGRAIHRPQIPEDVSGSVVFLLSDAARFITGQLLTVNGGFVMN
jgi:NAD(P)-dependent dehydrogenase (short-subunit alcohol dehydrogenase family)